MRISILSGFVFLSLSAGAQTNCCTVMQYEGTDTIHGIDVRNTCYTSFNKISVDKIFPGWKNSDQESTPAGTYTYAYTDTTCTGWKYADANGDSTRTEFQYDLAGKLTRQSYFELKLLQGGGTRLVQTPDGPREEPIRRWEQTSLVNFTYDKDGHKILYDATRLHYSAQNMYKWEYDEKGRVSKQECYSRGKLTWKEDYQYYDWGYRYWRTWYDFDGDMRHEKSTEDPAYMPLLFYNVKLDKQGRVTEESISDEKQHPMGKTITFYDKKGRIAKTIYYNGSGERRITHAYTYTW